jgi:uncharacterized protein (TIGR02453 family)
MDDFPGFTEHLFSFLRNLADHNDKRWFEANRRRYEEAVKEPALRFISAFGPYLRAVSPHFQAIPTAQGGSLFRIHRDTRFSRDKSPYKTNTGLHFRHEAGRDAHAPGFYIHLAPDDVFFGAGYWQPDGPTAFAIRTRISEKPDEWSAVKGALGRTSLSLAGDSLIRPPRGFSPDDPFIGDIRRRDFLASTQLDEHMAVSPEFIGTAAGLCAQSAPLMRFLCAAVDLPF